MMFTIVISVIYGIWPIFVPESIMSAYGTPEEFVNLVVLNVVMLFGVVAWVVAILGWHIRSCLLYTSPSPRDRQKSRMPSSA